MEPNNQNQYDFILSSQQQQKKSLLPATQSTKNRLLIFILLIVGTITVLVVGIQLLNNIGKVNNDDLVTVQAYQVELNRILEEVSANTDNPTLKNQFITLQVTLASDQAKLASLLSDRGVKLSEEQLASKEDTEKTDELENAQKNGSYDESATKLVESISNDYFDALKTAANDSASETEDEILQTSANNLQTIISQK